MTSLLDNLSVGAKIRLIPAVAIVGLVLNLGYSFTTHQANTARLADVRTEFFPLVREATAARHALDKITDLLSSAVSTGEADMLDAAAAEAGRLRAALGDMADLAHDPGAIERARTLFEAYYTTAASLSTSMVDGTADFARLGDQVATMQTALDDARGALQAVLEEAERGFNSNLIDADAAAESSLWAGLAVALATLLALAFTAWQVGRQITNALTRISASMAAIASGDGDLTQRLHSDANDEIGALVHHFNTFVEHLHDTIEQVVATLQPLADVSSNLQMVSGDFATTAESQATASTTTRRSVSSMVDSVGYVSDQADEAAKVTGVADEEARNGHSSMQATVTVIDRLAQEVANVTDSMKQLETETSNVSSIVEVIRNIAEQTNLLALNAAIEAARAGEQGRGFAVVADEVRTLASRTQESTQQIQDVIHQLQSSASAVATVMEQSRGSAFETVEKARETGGAFERIAEHVSRIASMNQDIARKMDEQRHVSRDIDGTVATMSARAEEGASTSRSVGEVSEALNAITRQLQNAAGRFRL